MAGDFDLDAYLQRLQWDGSLEPTLDTLAKLLRAHLQHIPFENLDVLLGRPVRLDLEGVQKKLVHARRGGYCFEHGTLFAAALEAIGLQPTKHVARVIRFQPRSQAPRAHMFLTVPVDGRLYVADPGFGPFSARVPIPLHNGAEALAGHEMHCLIHEAPFWTLRLRVDGTLVDGWVTEMEEANGVDFEVGNHFTATHPASPFRNLLMMCIHQGDGRVTIMNRDVTFRDGSGTKTMQLADRSALRSLLSEHFGIDLPEAEQIRIPAVPEWT